MNNKEILTKVLEKAKANGYHWFEGVYLGEPPYLEVKAAHDEYPYFVLVSTLDGRTETNVSVEEIIFSHKFAKAFWPGDHIERCYCFDQSYNMRFDPECNECKGKGEWASEELWRYNLKKMALAENRFKFLEQFLDKNEV